MTLRRAADASVGTDPTRVDNLPVGEPPGRGRGVALTAAGGWLALLAALCLVPQVVTDPYRLRIAILVMMFAVAAMGLNLVLGFAGQFHFGAAAFFAIGAYATGLGTTKWHMNTIEALAFSGLVALVAGMIIGAPSLRIRGDYLALVTFGFAEIVRLVIVNSNFTGGSTGVRGIPLAKFGGFVVDDNKRFYYYGLGLLVASYVLCRRIGGSFVGRAWKAIRSDETAAASSGINTGRYKVLAFALSCFFGGVAGSEFASFSRFIAPNSFTVDVSVLLIIMVIIGGEANLLGCVLGAAIMISATETLRSIARFRTGFIGLTLIVIPIARYHLSSNPDLYRRPLTRARELARRGRRPDETA